ncbi:spherulation-specific family 4 protein [Streptomyces sp. ZYX-F-203]
MSFLVPLYVHPAEDPEAWRRLTEAADRAYGVVVNPADGPGTAPDPAFTAAGQALGTAGARLLGYVDTAYGSRPSSEIAEDVRRHREWYGVHGCFLDRVSATRDAVRRYRAIVRSLRRSGVSPVVLNPGVHPARAYARFADLLVTFEGPWSTYVAAFSRPDWTRRHPPGRFCHLVYGVPEALVPLAVRTAGERGAAVCGPVCGEPPNPWSDLTPALTGAER